MNILNADHYSCKTPDSRSSLSLYRPIFKGVLLYTWEATSTTGLRNCSVGTRPRATRSATSQSVVGLVPRHTYPHDNFVHNFLL